MNIGILTFHRAENFGATLQTYALQTYLSRLGYNVDIIDYRCRAIEMNYDILNPRILFSRKNIIISLKHYLKRFWNIEDRIVKKKRFEAFWNSHYHMTAPVFEVRNDMGYDVYITGSDQVWNLRLTHGLDRMYFLDFPMKANSKKISYAASTEYDPSGLLWKNRGVLSKLLSSFDSISVREDFLKKELMQFMENPISLCMDPTFLLSKADYIELSFQPKITEKYILIYHMTPSDDGVALAEHIAKLRGYKVIEIFGGYSNSKDRNRCRSNLGPSEILGYIAFAEVVITTSFHGLALSLIMNKEFWVMDHPGNIRQRNLLSLLGLESRLIANLVNCQVEAPIDYMAVANKLAQAVHDSKQFLHEALGK